MREEGREGKMKGGRGELGKREGEKGGGGGSRRGS